jgi:coenzyme F420-0:L-glutamate ligase/coenzyme F420-1:gamma-L-glutamate ligase
VNADASATRRLELIAPGGFPLIAPGDDLVDAILRTLAAQKIALEDGDILVLAQKIVSKAEGRYVDLARVTPSARAEELALASGKDARLVEAILSEASDVVRCRPGLIIVRHRLGLVLANAGVDRSNLPDCPDGEHVLLLPENPDASAASLREKLQVATGADVAVMIIDSLGRAWRVGTVGACIGVAGLSTVHDMRGHEDLFGRALVSTILGAGDEIAAAASLVMGQAAEGTPLVLVRNYAHKGRQGAAADLVRPLHKDLFQ